MLVKSLMLLLLLSQVLGQANCTDPKEEKSENKTSFAAVTIERVIQVLDWGNIAVEERIELEHKGNVFKGPFSRIDFQTGQNKEPVFTMFETRLPPNARDIYYRDKIGNISTSMVRSGPNDTLVLLKPRFPIFGGWKTNYVLGYNVPSGAHLFANGTEFTLKVMTVDGFRDAVVEKLRVKIILPENSRDIKLFTPFDVERLPDEIHKTFLDIEGRPTIVFEIDNLNGSHLQPFSVRYEFNRLYLMRKPLIVVVAVIILLLTFLMFCYCFGK